jgi:murein DD-endopeptidase MepM/ murein hydrolase activator NlpD
VTVRKLLLLAAVVLMLLMSIPAASPVAATDDPEQKLAEIQSQISDLNSKIKEQKGQRTELQQELATAQDRLEAVAAELTEAESKVQEVEAVISSTEDHLAKVQSELNDLELQLADTQVNIHSTHDQIVNRAVEMYMGGVPDLGTLVFGVADMTSATLGVNYAQEVVASSELLMNDLETLQALEARQKEAVEERKAAVSASLVELGTKRDELEADRVQVDIRRQEAQAEMDRQQGLLDKVNEDIRFVEGELTALERDSQQLEVEIAERQRASGERPSTVAWPVEGPITSPFGWRIHPIFGTKKLHTGIDIGVSYGTPIHAAASGIVILAQKYGGYGNATVIDHGGGLSTLYGHQSKIAVKVGQEVTVGQVIGYVGCTGYCTGPHLHFETRENGAPVDPMKYLP